MTATISMGLDVQAWISQRHGGGVSAAPFAELNLSHGVGDDTSAVVTNRAVAACSIGVEAGQVSWMGQVHGDAVAVVTRPTSVAGVDSLVTSQPGVALAVQVADCLPLVVADASAGVIGVAHSGRPGTALGIASRLVAEMSRQGAVPARMRALLGPAICGHCYEVPTQVQVQVSRSVPEAACRTRTGTAGLDLQAGVTAQLRRAGLRDLQYDPRCTLESPELFSYRRDGRTGRFAAYVWRS